MAVRAWEDCEYDEESNYVQMGRIIMTWTYISRCIGRSMSLNENENISSFVSSRKSDSVRILRTSIDVSSFVLTRYAPSLPNSEQI